MVRWIRRGAALGVLAAYFALRVRNEYAEWEFTGWLVLPPLAAWWLTRVQASRVWPAGLERVLLTLGTALAPIPSAGLLPALSAGFARNRSSTPVIDRVLAAAAAGVMTHEFLLRSLLWVNEHDSFLRWTFFVFAGTLFLLVEALLAGSSLKRGTRRPLRLGLGAVTVVTFAWLVSWLSIQANPTAYILAWAGLTAAVWFASRLGERDADRALEYYLLVDLIQELNRKGDLSTRVPALRYVLRKRAPAETFQFFVANRGEGWISVEDSLSDQQLPRLLTGPQLEAEASSRPPTAFCGRFEQKPVLWIRMAKRVGRQGDPALQRWLTLCAELIARTADSERGQWLQGRDDETGLRTLEWFHTQVHREWIRAQRYDESFAVVWARTAEPTWSLETQQIVTQLRHDLRPCDEVARVDPRAVALLLPRTDGVGAQIVAERICERLGATFNAGVASFPADEGSQGRDFCMLAEQRATCHAAC